MNFIKTADGITIVAGGGPVSVHSTDPRYPKVLAAIKEGDEAALATALQSLGETLAAAAKLSEHFSVEGGIVSFRGEPLEQALSTYLIALHEDDLPLDRMAKFCERLFRNPSFRAVQGLYAFLAKGRNAITDDGHFLAYKRISANYFDVHSGTVLNKPAALMSQEERDTLPRTAGHVTTDIAEAELTEVSMPRNKVNEDPEETCSFGLHVCSYDYLGHFGGERVIVCKVDPADVVAIPSDYRATKMRVCRYLVQGEIPVPQEDVLGTGMVHDDSDDPTDDDAPSYGVYVGFDDGVLELELSFSTRNAARRHAQDRAAAMGEAGEVGVVVVREVDDSEELDRFVSEPVSADPDPELPGAVSPTVSAPVEPVLVQGGEFEIVATSRNGDELRVPCARAQGGGISARIDALRQMRQVIAELSLDVEGGWYKVELLQVVDTGGQLSKISVMSNII